MTFAVSANGNPFPGLRSFEREHAHLFFGRNEQISDLIDRLKRHRFLSIVGMSGSGKSSLVRAGLIPRLVGSYGETETSGWRIAVLRPGRNPMHELAATLCREFVISEFDTVLQILRSSSTGLGRVARQYLGSGEKLLVLVDQFEELFRYRHETNAANETDDDAAFVKLLLAASGESKHPLPGFNDLPVYVVTTMRSDFLGECSRFIGLPEVLNESQYLIPRLTREQKRDVIEGPMKMAGDLIEPALVQRLLNDLGDKPDQLPTMQHALMRTWEQYAVARAQGKPVTVEDYEAIGCMADALNRDADRVHESLATDDSTATLTRRLFQRLVQADGADSETRSPTSLSELVAVATADEGDVKRVINIFQQRGFLTISRDQDPIIDITHESLIRGWSRLRTWVVEEAQSAAIYRRLADTATLYAKNEASLLVDPQLQLTLNWRDETKPNEAWAARYDARFAEAMEFLEQSRKQHHKRIKQQRRNALLRSAALVLGPLLLLAIVASIFATFQRNRAIAERDRSNRLLYDSNVYFASSALVSGQFTLAQDKLDELLEAGLGDQRGFEWFYLWRMIHMDEATLSAHSGYVTFVTFSPDGKTLASANLDHTVRLWDPAARTEVATLSGHSGSVMSVAFSPDGKTLASASYDNTVKLWDIATRTELITLTGPSDAVLSVAFSPDGKTLAITSKRLVHLWDTATRSIVGALTNHSDTVRAVTFSPDGKFFAAAGDDKAVTLWEIDKQVTTLSGHSDIVLSVAFSPDSKTLASASADKKVKLWNTATRTELATLTGHSDTVRGVAFSPDGKTLASASLDKTVKFWDTKAHKEMATLSGHSQGVWSVAFSPDGKILASASADNTVKLWDPAAPPPVANLSTHSDPVNSITFSPDGKTLASASDDKTVKLWDTVARNEITTFSGHSESVLSVVFSRDGKILASASDDKTVKLWDTVSRTEVATFSGHSKPVRAVAFSPVSPTLASGSADTTVKLWDVGARKEIATLSGHHKVVVSVAFSPDGKTLASGSADKTVKLWNTSTQREVGTLSGHTGIVFSLAFSPDGKTLASASADNTVKLWDTSTRKEVGTLSGYSGIVLSVAFSPDGRTMATSHDDKIVRLWDTATHKEVVTLSGHSEFVISVTFSPDGKILASASMDTVKLWFAATDEEVEERRRRGY